MRGAVVINVHLIVGKEVMVIKVTVRNVRILEL